MPEHFTRNTVSASYWCNKCGKATQHRVDGGRRGPCFACIARATQAPAAKAPDVEQTSMFTDPLVRDKRGD